MKSIIYLPTFISFLLFGCSGGYTVETVTSKSIIQIQDNAESVIRIINLSQEISNRNQSPNIEISFHSQKYEVTSSQVKDNETTKYCIGKDWRLSDVDCDSTFKVLALADSFNISSVLKELETTPINSVNIKNGKLEFVFEESPSVLVTYNLSKKTNGELEFTIPNNLDSLERPCNIYLGSGFNLIFKRLEHGIT